MTEQMNCSAYVIANPNPNPNTETEPELEPESELEPELEIGRRRSVTNPTAIRVRCLPTHMSRYDVINNRSFSTCYSFVNGTTKYSILVIDGTYLYVQVRKCI